MMPWSRRSRAFFARLTFIITTVSIRPGPASPARAAPLSPLGRMLRVGTTRCKRDPEALYARGLDGALLRHYRLIQSKMVESCVKDCIMTREKQKRGRKGKGD